MTQHPRGSSNIVACRFQEGGGESILRSCGLRPMAHNYRVYIIDLTKAVLKSGRFRTANPDYKDGKPCVYVGSTALAPSLLRNEFKDL